jgi:hypothetical protein
MIEADITRENTNAGYMLALQIHNGEISLTQVADANRERPIVPGLDGGDMHASLTDVFDLLRRLVTATAFKPGQKVTWPHNGETRHGTVHTTEDNDGFYGPTVVIRTEKGGYTKVGAVYVERV